MSDRNLYRIFCDCDGATPCPQGRTGTAARCSIMADLGGKPTVAAEKAKCGMCGDKGRIPTTTLLDAATPGWAPCPLCNRKQGIFDPAGASPLPPSPDQPDPWQVEIHATDPATAQRGIRRNRALGFALGCCAVAGLLLLARRKR